MIYVFKDQIKRILKKIPFAYEISRKIYGSYTSIFVFSKDKVQVKKNLDLLRNTLSLINQLNLKKIEINQKSCILQLIDDSKFILNPEIKNPLLTIPLTGYFENKETTFLKSKIKKDSVIFDIGANFGWYSVHFSKFVGLNGQIHCFEPVQEAFSELEENVKINDCSNVVLNNTAIGKENGKLTLYVSDKLGTAFTSEHGEGKKIETNLLKLDYYFADKNLTKIDLIKADVEGGELNVLYGAERILDEFHPALFIEVQEEHTMKYGYKPVDLFNFLIKKGYKIYYLDQNSKLCELKDFEILPTYNFYCSHSNINEIN